MSDTSTGFSRRGLLVSAATASAATLTGAAPALAAEPTGTAQAAAAAGAGPFVTPLVARDRIATAVLRTAGGGTATLRFHADLHERLTEWLAFWSANSPAAWGEPVELRGRTDASGAVFTLTHLRYRHGDQVRDGFSAERVDRAYWATLASLHHHFPSVRPVAGGVDVTGGAAGFAATPEQLAFAASACQVLWGYRAAGVDDWRGSANRALRRTGQPAEIASRTGWAAFTRTSLRLGLDTESY